MNGDLWLQPEIKICNKFLNKNKKESEKKNFIRMNMNYTRRLEGAEQVFSSSVVSLFKDNGCNAFRAN